MNVLDLGLFAAGIRLSTPVLLAALGGLFTQQANILNIALEGMMLFGAFAGVFTVYYTGSVPLAVLAAVAVGMLVSLLFAVFTIRFRADAVVAGIALNLFSSGATIFLLRAIFKTKGAFSGDKVLPLPRVTIPGLEAVPVIGPLLSGHSVLVYVAFLLVPVCHVLLYHTRLGLRIRAVGEYAPAAQAVGVNPDRIRYLAVLISGALSGLAGVHLSMGYLQMFVENMVAGRGFMAIAAIMFGKATPVGTMLASLVFGLADALGARLQTLGYPSQFVLMLPYAITVIVLVAVAARSTRRVRRRHAPAAPAARP